MAKRTTKSTTEITTSTPVAVETITTVATEPAIVATVATDPAIVPATDTPMTFVDVTGPFAVVVPAVVVAMRDAFASDAVRAAIAPTSAPMTDDAVRAMAATFHAVIAARANVIDATRIGTRAIGITGRGIGDTQTDIAVAATMAGVFAPRTAARADVARVERVITAMWVACIPNAACRFVERRYGWSTTRDIIIATKHPGAASFADAVRAARAIAFPVA